MMDSMTTFPYSCCRSASDCITQRNPSIRSRQARKVVATRAMFHNSYPCFYLIHDHENTVRIRRTGKDWIPLNELRILVELRKIKKDETTEAEAKHHEVYHHYAAQNVSIHYFSPSAFLLPLRTYLFPIHDRCRKEEGGTMGHVSGRLACVAVSSFRWFRVWSGKLKRSCFRWLPQLSCSFCCT